MRARFCTTFRTRVWVESADWEASAAGIAPATGTAGQTLALEPGNPAVVYLATEGGANGPSFFTPGVPDGTLCNTTCARLAGEASLWRGDFSQFESTGAAQWTLLPGPPIAADTTPSGNAFVVTKATSAGFLVFFSDNSHVHVSVGRTDGCEFLASARRARHLDRARPGP